MRFKVKLAKKRASQLEHDEAKGLTAALDALGGRSGPPTEFDQPPLSTFPMTPAAREARRLDREKGKEW